MTFPQHGSHCCVPVDHMNRGILPSRNMSDSAMTPTVVTVPNSFKKTTKGGALTVRYLHFSRLTGLLAFLLLPSLAPTAFAQSVRGSSLALADPADAAASSGG